MSLKQKAIKSVKGLCLALAINQLAGGLLTSTLSAYSPRVETRLEEFLRYQSLSPNANALEYTNAANELVHAKASEGCDCKDYALATFITYSQLIEKDKRDDLEKKLRIVSAIPSVSEEAAHVWLEVEQNGEFTPYESYSSSKDRSQINGDLDKDGWIMARSFNGTRIFHPTVESFFYPGGFMRLVYLAHKYNSGKE